MAVSHDASDTGLLLLAQEQLEPATRVSVSFRVPPETGVRYSSSATVVRCSENADDPGGL
ncbi:MAG: PilZ domain-containing protein [Polyangiaceae bacterium]|nr:PilZ domain-containing protein [Polyangiaceae bacterium]